MFGEERKGRWKEEKTKRLGIVTRLESRVNKDPAIRLFLEWKPLNLILTSFLIDLFSTIYERYFLRSPYTLDEGKRKVEENIIISSRDCQLPWQEVPTLLPR